MPLLSAHWAPNWPASVKEKKKKWRWLAASAVTPLRGTSKKVLLLSPPQLVAGLRPRGRPSAACFIFPFFPPPFLFLLADARWLNSSPHRHRAREQNCSWSVLSAALITPDSPRPVCPLHTGRGQHESLPGLRVGWCNFRLCEEQLRMTSCGSCPRYWPRREVLLIGETISEFQTE